jgi:SAM-dependent methyltransferase
MRNYGHIENFLDELLGDIYEQPEDAGHTKLAQEVIDFWMSRLADCHSVLDVGCGTGFCQPMFEKHGIAYRGVALGKDVLVAQELNRNVTKMDFTFLDYPDKSFDMVFSRHSLEHSPMPLITLMEWARVSMNWLGLIVPAPEHYTFEGLNHYSVMNLDQLQVMAARAGWKPIWTDKKLIDESNVPQEYWVFYEKVNRK